MKTISVPKDEKEINELLRQARRDNIILCSPDGAEFILAEIDDFKREIELTRQNVCLMKFLMQRAKLTKTISLRDAKEQLGL